MKRSVLLALQPIRDFTTHRRPFTNVRTVKLLDGHHEHGVVFFRNAKSKLVIQVDGKNVWTEPDGFSQA